MNKILARGLLFLGIALVFFTASFQYQIGKLEDPGPALFPMIVSAVLALFGVVTMVRSYRTHETISAQVKNIFTVVLSIVCFAAASMTVNMLLGTVVLVVIALTAVKDYQFGDVVKLSVGLSLVAAFMTYVLGLNLPLWK